jgi:tetratricopeptide (TPR) repeat protein
MALSQDGENLEAHLGLGMARFELKQYQAALDQFQAVIRLDPDRAAGFINAAMCLQQLQKPAEALPLWKRAQGLTKNPVLHQQIETHLARISGGH